MAEHELKNIKFSAHVDAVEKHKALLEKLHLDSNTHLDEVNNSIEQLTLTLEEYLKVIGIPQLKNNMLWKPHGYWLTEHVFYIILYLKGSNPLHLTCLLPNAFVLFVAQNLPFPVQYDNYNLVNVLLTDH